MVRNLFVFCVSLGSEARFTKVGKLSVKEWQESRETRQALLQKRMDDAIAQKRAAFLAKQQNKE